MQANSSQHKAALLWAEQGIPVFPCLPNSKKPATVNGFKDASADVAQIDAWWSEDPNYNLAVSPEAAGWAVVDLDGGEVGETAWAKVQEQHGTAPATYEVRTPRGGRHLYFEGTCPSSVQTIGEKIDTRGLGGYVLLPPSIVDGKPYTVSVRAEIAPLPAWVPMLTRKHQEKHQAAVEGMNLPANVSRAIAFLKARAPAIEGQGGDNHTLMTCFLLRDLGISQDKALELLQEHWNPRCEPPWEEDALADKLSRDKDNEDGAWADAGTPADVFGAALQNMGVLGNEAAVSERPPRFKAYSILEMRQRPPIKYMIPEILRERGMAMLYGQSQSMKSFLALDICLHLATGTKGWGREGGEQLNVAYFAAESPEAMCRDRAQAWQMLHGVPDEKLDTFKLFEDVPECRNPEDVAEMAVQVIAQDIKPDIIVIDTLAYFMTGMDENSAKDASLAFSYLKEIERTFNCMVMVVHHMGKSGREARGSSAFGAGFDTTMEMKRIEKSVALELWMRKQKDGKMLEHPLTFRHQVLGPSLVLSPTSAEEHRKVARQGSFLDAGKIALVLKTFSEPVSAYVLANSLLPASDVQSPEQRALDIDRIGTAIEKAAEHELAAFSHETEDGLRFTL